jgi:integrase
LPDAWKPVLDLAHKKKAGKGRRFMELSFHSLRHTAISEQANRGISREVRMKLSGHKSAVHDRYTHHELETLRREVEKVPACFPTPEGTLDTDGVVTQS